MEIARIANHTRQFIDLLGYRGSVVTADGKIQLTVLGSLIKGQLKDNMVDVDTMVRNFARIQLELDPSIAFEIKWTKDGEFERVHPFGWIRDDAPVG